MLLFEADHDDAGLQEGSGEEAGAFGSYFVQRDEAIGLWVVDGDAVKGEGAVLVEEVREVDLGLIVGNCNINY